MHNKNKKFSNYSLCYPNYSQLCHVIHNFISYEIPKKINSHKISLGQSD